MILFVLLMAIPPPHVFINVESATMVDAHTLEVTFPWPRCADEKSIAANWFGASEVEAGKWDVRFSLQELRKSHQVPSCTGPVEKQTRRVDLRKILPDNMKRGRLQINDESLYGHMKKAPAFTVEFDVRPNR